MKRAVALVCCLLLFWMPARAIENFSQTDGENEMRQALDGESQSLLDKIAPDGDLTRGLYSILQNTQQEQNSAIRSAVSTLASIAVIVVLCGCMGSFFKDSSVQPLAVRIAGALGITTVAFGSLSDLMQVCGSTVEEIQIFSKSMLPVMTTAISLSGAPTAAALMSGGTMLTLDICISVITDVFLPAMTAYVAMVTVDAAIGNDMLSRLAAFVKWLIVSALKLLLTVFFSCLTISGTVAHGIDSSAVKATKFALSGTIPVVGGILSGATDTVLSGAVLLKNSLGVFGMLCAATVCLVPFLRIGISYLVFRAGSALLSPICPKELTGLMDGIADSVGVIFGMIGSCSAIMFFELVYAVVMLS